MKGGTLVAGDRPRFGKERGRAFLLPHYLRKGEESESVRERTRGCWGGGGQREGGREGGGEGERATHIYRQTDGEMERQRDRGIARQRRKVTKREIVCFSH